MADRFPSIEDVDAGTTGANADLINDSTDANDFLARERAALGNDADQFSTAQDIPSVSIEDGNDDLLDSGMTNGGASSELNQFQTSFPAIDSQNDRVAPGGTITGSTSPFLPGAPTSGARAYSPAPSYPPEEEPQVVKEWRERRSMAIQAREDAAASRKAETVQSAQEAIDEFYENYNTRKDKQLAQSRKDAEEFLKNRDDTTSGGTSWERIAKLVDVKGPGGKGGAAGKERFRELLVGLTKDENAPGAKGY